jgi:hypothetical protein
VSEKKGEIKYIVTLSRIFEFLSCTIDKNESLTDLVHKTKEGFLESAGRPDFINNFKIDISSELPFQTNTKISKDVFLSVNDLKVNQNNMFYYIREFVVADVEEKYGKLELEVNPHLFVEVEYPQFKPGESVPYQINVEYELKEDVLNYWNHKYNHYIQILTKKGIQK